MGAFTRVALLVPVWLLAGCQLGTFACQSDAQCESGMCQPDGYCSFPDDDCDSGQRYGDAAPGELSGTCVAPADGTSSTSTTATTPGDPTSLDSGSSPTTDAVTTEPDSSSGSSGQGLESSEGESTVGVSDGSSTGTGSDTSTEVCDGVDNDRDGITDEWSLQNTSCDGCTLLQDDGRAYWFCDNPKTWQSAENFCRAYGPPTLATVDTASVNTFIASNFFTDEPYWIGLSRDSDAEAWGWVDATPFVYEAWAATQPDLLAPACAVIDASEWFDEPCASLFSHVCSTPHDP